jgi:catechol 2,3-dioxygenase-like lactoylglutathione lyase family enzyme
VNVSQIALSVADLERSERFYRDVLGFLPSGGERIRGRIASRVIGLPDVDAECRWLVGRDRGTQLELFQFRRPVPAQRRLGASAPGWRSFAVHVGDLDSVLARLGDRGGPVDGAPGARRCKVTDPDGVALELVEADPGVATAARHPAGAAMRAVTLGAVDPERMRRFFEVELGLDGTSGPIRVEIVLAEPSAERPRLHDLGLLNIALGFRERSAFRRCVDRVRGRLVSAPLDAGVFSVVYCAGPEDVSVELLYVHRLFERFTGYVPRTSKERSWSARIPSR